MRTRWSGFAPHAIINGETQATGVGGTGTPPLNARHEREEDVVGTAPPSNTIREREEDAAGTPSIKRDTRTRGGRGWHTPNRT